jgi:transcription elongation factor GreA
MTDAIKRKLQEEINALEHELIHELPKEIKKAAALGDLSENAEYHMAKQRQEFVKARVRQLGKRLADLSMVNMNNIPHDKVGLGSTVKIYDNTKNQEMEYKIVTSEESDVAAGKISTTSPIGRCLAQQESWRHRHRGQSQRQARTGNPDAQHHPRRGGRRTERGRRKRKWPPVGTRIEGVILSGAAFQVE